MNLFDRALFAVLKCRLARCTIPGDGADRLSDAVLAFAQVLNAELERRNRILHQWQRAAEAVKARRTERRQFLSTEVAKENFL